MTVFESLSETVDESAKSAKSYINSSESLIKLQLFKHIALIMTFLIKVIAIGGVLLLALTLFAVCCILLLGDWLGSMILACLIIGVLFLLISAIIYANRKLIDKKVLNSFSKKF